MMEIRGDLLKAFEEGRLDYIGHQCNCFNTFGAGLAYQIKQRFPKAFKADKETARGDLDKLGTFTLANNIFNLYGQFNYGVNKQQTDYDALERSLIKMRDYLLANERDKVIIGFPRLGCGLAGGDWNVVKEIIRRVFKPYEERMEIKTYYM